VYGGVCHKMVSIRCCSTSTNSKRWFSSTTSVVQHMNKKHNNQFIMRESPIFDYKQKGIIYKSVFPQLSLRIESVHGSQDLDKKDVQKIGQSFDSAIDLFTAGHGQPRHTALEVLDGAITHGMGDTVVGLIQLLGMAPSPGFRKPVEQQALRVQQYLSSGLAGESWNNIPHMKAFVALYNNEPLKALSHWEECLLQNPIDVLALRCAQATYVQVGDLKNSLSCVERVIGSWSTDEPGYARMIGMHAYGLVQNGHHIEAEEEAGRSLTVDQDNDYSTLACAYNFAESGRFREGLRLLRELRENFEESTIHGELLFLKALFNMEAGKFTNALFACDCISDFSEQGTQENFIFIVGSLWRLGLQGVNDEMIKEFQEETETRDKNSFFGNGGWFSSGGETGKVQKSGLDIRTMAELYEGIYKDGACAFSLDDDIPIIHVHKVIALCGYRKLDEAEEYIRLLEEHASDSSVAMEKGLVHMLSSIELLPPSELTRQVTLPLCQAILAFSQENWDKCFEILIDTKRNWHLVGGTKTITDLFDQTMFIALFKSAGIHTDLGDDANQILAPPSFQLACARALINDKVSRHPLSPRLWGWHSAVYMGLGDEINAELSKKRSLEMGFGQGGSGSH